MLGPRVPFQEITLNVAIWGLNDLREGRLNIEIAGSDVRCENYANCRVW